MIGHYVEYWYDKVLFSQIKIVLFSLERLPIKTEISWRLLLYGVGNPTAANSFS